jgi:hypothetical protein
MNTRSFRCHDSHSFAQSCLWLHLGIRLVRGTTAPKTASRGTGDFHRPVRRTGPPGDPLRLSRTPATSPVGNGGGECGETPAHNRWYLEMGEHRLETGAAGLGAIGLGYESTFDQ